MVNESIMDINYNLSKVFTQDIVNDPVTWFGALTNEVGGFITLGILIALGIILFLAVRKREEVTDVEAGMYAGLITSIIGVMLFLISLPLEPGTKILTWVQLVPILVITGIFIILSRVNKRY